MHFCMVSVRSMGVQKFRDTEVQKLSDTEVQTRRDTEVKKYSDTEVQKYAGMLTSWCACGAQSLDEIPVFDSLAPLQNPVPFSFPTCIYAGLVPLLPLCACGAQILDEIPVSDSLAPMRKLFFSLLSCLPSCWPRAPAAPGVPVVQILDEIPVFDSLAPMQKRLLLPSLLTIIRNLDDDTLLKCWKQSEARTHLFFLLLRQAVILFQVRMLRRHS